MKYVLILLSLSISGFTFAQEIYEHSEKYNVNPTGKLTLDTEDADIKIVGIDGDQLHVEVVRSVEKKGAVKYSNKFKLEYILSDGNLEIKEESNSNYSVGVGYLSIDYKIYLEVPHGMSLHIKGEDDDYAIDGISGDIDLFCEDGDAVLSQCTGDRLKLKNEDGDILIKSQNSKECSIQTEDGDIRIVNSRMAILNAKTEDGLIDLDLTASVDAMIKAEDGDILVDNRNAQEHSSFIIDIEDGDLKLNSGFVSELKVTGEDGDIRTNCSLLPDSDVKIKVGDGDVEFLVESGVSHYEIYTGEGDIYYPRGVEVIKDREHHVAFNSGKSDANVEIRSVDGDISVR